MLDLNYFVTMVLQTSEIDRACNILNSYKMWFNNKERVNESVFGVLLNDLTGKRTHISTTDIYHCNAKQFCYWILNPYYGRMLTGHIQDDIINKIKKVFCSENFWNFVLANIQEQQRTGFEQWNFDSSFKGFITSLFSMDLKDNVRNILIEVHALL